MKFLQVAVKMPKLLLHRLNIQAEREPTDVSALVCKLAETHLGHREPVPPEVRAVEYELPAIVEKIAKAKRRASHSQRRKGKGT